MGHLVKGSIYCMILGFGTKIAFHRFIKSLSFYERRICSVNEVTCFIISVKNGIYRHS